MIKTTQICTKLFGAKSKKLELKCLATGDWLNKCAVYPHRARILM